MKQLKTILTIALLAVFVSCGDDNSNTGNPNDNTNNSGSGWGFANVGNKWVWEYSDNGYIGTDTY